MHSTKRLLLRRGDELVAPVRYLTRTAPILDAPSARMNSVGRRNRSSYRPRLMTTSVMTNASSSSSSSSSSPLSSSSSSSPPRPPPRLRFRRGTRDDAPTLFSAVLDERMLPFGLHPERFIIAEEDEEEEDEEDEEEGGGREGGGEEEGERRRRRRRVVAFGQLVELKSDDGDDALLFELRSLVTAPEFRGRGIGAEVVRRLLEKATARKEEKEKEKEKEEKKRARGASVIMTTIRRRVPFYERLGFSVLSPPPRELLLEIAIGSVVARIAVGDSIVAMGKKL